MKQKIQEKGYSVKSLTLEISNDEQYTLKRYLHKLPKGKMKKTTRLRV